MLIQQLSLPRKLNYLLSRIRLFGLFANKTENVYPHLIPTYYHYNLHLWSSLSLRRYFVEMLDPSGCPSDWSLSVCIISQEELRVETPDVVFVLFGSKPRAILEMDQIGKVFNELVIKAHLRTNRLAEWNILRLRLLYISFGRMVHIRVMFNPFRLISLLTKLYLP